MFVLWALSHFLCGRPFFLTPAHQIVALQAAALPGDGLGTAHYLSDYGKLLIARGGESPGRLVGPGAKRRLTKGNIVEGTILIIQIIRRVVPELVTGGPKSWYFSTKG